MITTCYRSSSLLFGAQRRKKPLTPRMTEKRVAIQMFQAIISNPQAYQDKVPEALAIFARYLKDEDMLLLGAKAFKCLAQSGLSEVSQHFGHLQRQIDDILYHRLTQAIQGKWRRVDFLDALYADILFLAQDRAVLTKLTELTQLKTLGLRHKIKARRALEELNNRLSSVP